MDSIAQLTLLQTLDVAGCTATQAGIDHLTTLTALQTLDMSWTLAQHPPALQQLRSLCIGHCTLGGSWEITFALHESQVRHRVDGS